ncbi:hypothetical protein IWQ62_004227 [Dispira parvispora]|uniref:Uncharacterized protein n=1 Tax=Dispira parvispora TaxID=1520584 RepID=A0A9W8E6C1_9FUNG|nr:hypothetical protein IWQ62_004227 [Dispira parvispora]
MSGYTQRDGFGRTRPWLIGAAVNGVMVLVSIGFFIAAAVIRSNSDKKPNGMPVRLTENIALNAVGAIFLAVGLCGLLWCALRLNRIYAIREQTMRADQAVQSGLPSHCKDGVVVLNEDMHVTDMKAYTSSCV